MALGSKPRLHPAKIRNNSSFFISYVGCVSQVVSPDSTRTKTTKKKEEEVSAVFNAFWRPWSMPKVPNVRGSYCWGKIVHAVVEAVLP